MIISEGEWGINKYSHHLCGSSWILASKGSKEMNSWVLFVSVVVNGISMSQSRSGVRSVRRCSLTEHIAQIKHTQAAIFHTEWATRPVGAMTDPSTQPISSDLTRGLSDRPFVESHCRWVRAKSVEVVSVQHFILMNLFHLVANCLALFQTLVGCLHRHPSHHGIL